jgi:multidrug efflux pump subunit AcrB
MGSERHELLGLVHPQPDRPILAFVLLCLMGWQSFNRLPITQFPSIDVPLVSVRVAQPGAAPVELETQVTREIEDAVRGISGVKNVQSTITDGMSSTVIEFRMEVPTDQAVQDVKDQIDQIRGDLPADVDEPTVTRIEVEGVAILTFAVSAPAMSFEELSWFVDDAITSELQGLPGVGRVDRYGGADREILVTLDPSRLDAYGITAASVSQQISLTNANQGAGRAALGNGEQAIRVLGDQGDVDRLASTTIALPTGQRVRLDQLGTVTDTYEELRSFTKVGGEDVVAFSVFRAKGASEVSVDQVVRARLDEIRAANPGVSIDLVDDAVYFTYGNYKAAIHTLIEGAILAVLVVLLFLRNWRATLISAVALPLSAIPTFWAMDLLGFSLNLVSFLALTLATGISWTTPSWRSRTSSGTSGWARRPTAPPSTRPTRSGWRDRHHLHHRRGVRAGELHARHPGAVFPAVRSHGRHRGAVLAAGRAPHHAAHGGLSDADQGRGRARSSGTGLHARLHALRAGHDAAALPHAAVGLRHPGVSIYFMTQVPGSLFPPDDSSRFQLSVELPPGSTLEDTERATDAITAAIRDVDGVDDVFVVGGSSPTGGLDIRRASITVILERLDTRSSASSSTSWSACRW